MSKTEKLEGVGGNHRGLNMQLYSGKPFYPKDPQPEEIDIEDIAHALSMQCRYNGHCRIFYSVAEHSVLVSKLVPAEYARWALLHDIEEGYSGDLIRPFKYQMLELWEEWTEPLRKALAIKFNLPLDLGPEVKHADWVALAIEKRDIMNPPIGVDWGRMPEAPEDHFAEGWSPECGKKMFLRRYHELNEAYIRGEVL